jgi:hypothetical protein
VELFLGLGLNKSGYVNVVEGLLWLLEKQVVSVGSFGAEKCYEGTRCHNFYTVARLDYQHLRAEAVLR